MFLILALYGGEWLASCSSYFTPPTPRKELWVPFC